MTHIYRWWHHIAPGLLDRAALFGSTPPVGAATHADDILRALVFSPVLAGLAWAYHAFFAWLIG